jgi:hypothetical protein
MKKLKVAFYGNCHLSVISRWVEENHCDRFEIVDCKKAGVIPFWGGARAGDKNFTLWAPANSSRLQEIKEAVHRELKTCDIFIFQPHESSDFFPELKTSFLIENIIKGFTVCMPNTRMFVYPTESASSLKDLVTYVKTNISSQATKIIDYLKAEDDPRFFEILEESIKNQNSDNLKFEKNIPHDICMLDYIGNNWKTELLFCQHNHPTEFYYKELIKRLFEFLNIEYPTISDIAYPSAPYIVNPLQFKFFEKICPDLKFPTNLKLQDLTEEFLLQNKLL